MQKISQNGMMFDKLGQYMQLALMLAKKSAPEYVMQIAADIQATTGQAPNIATPGASGMPESDNIAGLKKKEHGVVEKARERANEASQPGA